MAQRGLTAFLAPCLYASVVSSSSPGRCLLDSRIRCIQGTGPGATVGPTASRVVWPGSQWPLQRNAEEPQSWRHIIDLVKEEQPWSPSRGFRMGAS